MASLQAECKKIVFFFMLMKGEELPNMESRKYSSDKCGENNLQRCQNPMLNKTQHTDAVQRNLNMVKTLKEFNLENHQNVMFKDLR